MEAFGSPDGLLSSSVSPRLPSLVRCYRDAKERAQVLVAVLAKLLRRARDKTRQDDLFPRASNSVAWKQRSP